MFCFLKIKYFLYTVKYLNEETDFSKLPKFGKIVKFTINPREEHITILMDMIDTQK